MKHWEERKFGPDQYFHGDLQRAQRQTNRGCDLRPPPKRLTEASNLAQQLRWRFWAGVNGVEGGVGRCERAYCCRGGIDS